MSTPAVTPHSDVDPPGEGLTIHLRIGALDPRSTRVLRELLLARAEPPGTHLVVDLGQMDHHHEMTLFALLAAKARAVTETLGRMTAVGPTQRLAQLLVAIGVTVTRELPVVTVLARVEMISVGQLRDLRT